MGGLDVPMRLAYDAWLFQSVRQGAEGQQGGHS